jgi:hypothetical protein
MALANATNRTCLEVKRGRGRFKFTGGFDGYYYVHLLDVKGCGLKEVIMPIQEVIWGDWKPRDA